MPEGTLEVNLVSAKGLENTDVLFNMDPYVILSYKTQEKKSNVASGKGSNPEWNETFLFNISSSDSTDLKIKIMDSDTGSADDLVGHASVPLDALFHDGDIPAKSYNVMKDDAYCGEIRIGLNFTAQRSRDFDPADGNMGGWKQSGD
ncbi:elicitor-responsive protein 3-like [Bidens hawaiensis]|uniref:elicitor-responsive protein 3-like n=1 Tax=Bidens hawaiensis TaxID=980011 RepID=UPI0040499F68